VWHVCSMGTHIKTERDVFISGTGAFAYMTDYRQNEPDMFGYIIEITGISEGSIRGNVFETGNYAEYAKHIRETALPPDTVSLTYSDNWGKNAGKTVTVSRREYDDDRNRLMCESGDVTAVHWHPAKETDLTQLLLRERSERMAYPVGGMDAHLDMMTSKLVEIRDTHENHEEMEEKRPAPTKDYKAQKQGKAVVKSKMPIGDRLITAKEKVNAQSARKAPGSRRDTRSIE